MEGRGWTKELGVSVLFMRGKNEAIVPAVLPAGSG